MVDADINACMLIGLSCQCIWTSRMSGFATKRCFVKMPQPILIKLQCDPSALVKLFQERRNGIEFVSFYVMPQSSASTAHFDGSTHTSVEWNTSFYSIRRVKFRHVKQSALLPEIEKAINSDLHPASKGFTPNIGFGVSSSRTR